MLKTNLKTAELVGRQADWLKDYRPSIRIKEQGKVISIGDGIAWISGLPMAAIDDILAFEDGSRAMVFDLTENQVGFCRAVAYKAVRGKVQSFNPFTKKSKGHIQ